MVTQHWRWLPHSSQGASYRIDVRKWTNAELVILILADRDPRLHKKATQCKCPRIGRRYCPHCMGEGRYYTGKTIMAEEIDYA